MGLLILLLLCPMIFGQVHQQKSRDPNDEPFLPIFPVYPYNPKLMKRGVDKETETRLTAELYAPKVDSRDSYSDGYGSNYQRDPYYPNYDPYPKTLSSSSTPSSSPYTSSSPSYISPSSSSPYTPSSSSYIPSSSSYTPSSSSYTPSSSSYIPSSSSYTPSYMPSYTPYYVTNPPSVSGSYSTLSPYNIYDNYANSYASSTIRTPVSSNAYTSSPYMTSYSTLYPPNPYTGAPYSPPPYMPGTNYYHQQPYYYPAGYYVPPMFPPQPPPPPSQKSGYNKDLDSDSKENDEKDSGRSQKSKDENKNQEVVNDGQFVDGGNYISANSRDLESQSSSYKSANQYDQLEQTNDSRESSVPNSRTYKIINVGTQPSDTDYSIAATYAKTKQLEQLMKQTLAKLLAQNTARQIVPYPVYDSKQTPLIKANEVFYGNQNGYDNRNTQAYILAPNTMAKNGLNYIINRQGPGNVNADPTVPRQVLQASTTLSRTAKYPNDQYLRKPVTRVSLQQSQGLYIPSSKTVQSSSASQSTSGYEVYQNDDSSQTNQNYGDSLENSEGKQEQDYENTQDSTGAPYKNQNFVTVQTPQVYSYRYTSLHPQQTTSQQESQEFDDNISDVEFGTKQNSKQ